MRCVLAFSLYTRLRYRDDNDDDDEDDEEKSMSAYALQPLALRPTTEDSNLDRAQSTAAVQQYPTVCVSSLSICRTVCQSVRCGPTAAAAAAAAAAAQMIVNLSLST